jgi:HEAT repeat protein
MKSYNWDRFYESFFGNPYMAWHDGLDVDALNSLTGEENEEAERLLIEALQKSNDYRPIVGLGEIRSKKALSILKQKLERLSGRALIDAASALRKIEDDDSYAEYIIRVLKFDYSEFDRLWAAMELRYFNTPEVIKALFEAVKDPSYLVRNHACESLLALHGIKPRISEYPEIFQNIIGPSENDNRPIDDNIMQFEQAIQQLKELFKRKALDSTKSNAQKSQKR